MSFKSVNWCKSAVKGHHMEKSYKIWGHSFEKEMSQDEYPKHGRRRWHQGIYSAIYHYHDDHSANFCDHFNFF